ncbi:gamma carbonic anhydrase family protein [Xanthocytophaga agilis]|uniref:DapH/DapD/GlmU-related protein n=1 Tax=Xanthocytophaga agilis TaxID=3048010 RepID=A0AAE3QZU1_9BACT|nr:DapH/DapD/GlmU-related protein [Xanthocytophaga agilis]MDJ1501104.1 DapH/DapD/GlmU-related protein [Xanthocytophaga agilis]
MSNLQPTIHPSARIMQGVIIEGDVTIGENTYIGSGSIITANGGSIHIGNNTVIMENAIIRSNKKFPCLIGDNVLVGPKACITGAIIHKACFIATNATIFHGAELSNGTVLAVNGIIHVGTFCPENTFIPINHIGFGNPVKVYGPGEIQEFHAELRKVGFVKYVYDIDTTGLSNTDLYTKLTETFLANL